MPPYRLLNVIKPYTVRTYRFPQRVWLKLETSQMRIQQVSQEITQQVKSYYKST